MCVYIVVQVVYTSRVCVLAISTYNKIYDMTIQASHQITFWSEERTKNLVAMIGKVWAVFSIDTRGESPSLCRVTLLLGENAIMARL